MQAIIESEHRIVTFCHASPGAGEISLRDIVARYRCAVYRGVMKTIDHSSVQTKN